MPSANADGPGYAVVLAHTRLKARFTAETQRAQREGGVLQLTYGTVGPSQTAWGAAFFESSTSLIFRSFFALPRPFCFVTGSFWGRFRVRFSMI